MKVTDKRVLSTVPPYSMQPWAKRLKPRCDALIPPWCLDYGWIRGRGRPMAEAHVAALLVASVDRPIEYLDIISFFPSVEQERLWWLLRRADADLGVELQRFFRKLGCEEGLPEGCHFTTALANLYLSAIDSRWQGRAIRYGDNIACTDRYRMRGELANIGLVGRETDCFIRVAAPPRAAL